MTNVLYPTKLDPITGITLNMGAARTSGDDSPFDSYLLLHKDGRENHTLTLVLKIFLDPMLPPTANFPVGTRMAFTDGATTFLIKPWTPTEWHAFVTTFQRQCAFWNNKFWLIAPKDFSALDISLAGRKVRPNIYCHLYVDVVHGPGGAHRVISVVNLDLEDAARKKGVQQSELDNGSFRSSWDTYDSLDTKHYDTTVPDDDPAADAVPQQVTHYTIPHEIGHALGLPHIGQTHNDPLCNFAIAMDQNFPTVAAASTFPALFTGGSNSNACYGSYAPPNRGANVMGFGSTVEESNAQPWVDRIAIQTGTKPDAWTVSLARIGPKTL